MLTFTSGEAGQNGFSTIACVVATRKVHSRSSAAGGQGEGLQDFASAAVLHECGDAALSEALRVERALQGCVTCRVCADRSPPLAHDVIMTECRPAVLAGGNSVRETILVKSDIECGAFAVSRRGHGSGGAQCCRALAGRLEGEVDAGAGGDGVHRRDRLVEAFPRRPAAV